MRTRRFSRCGAGSLGVSLAIALALSGCAGKVPFQGKSSLSVLGELPPPPPPEPPPPPKAPVLPPRVELRDNKIEIREKIQFEYDKAIIREVSFGLLAEIA